MKLKAVTKRWPVWSRAILLYGIKSLLIIPYLVNISKLSYSSCTLVEHMNLELYSSLSPLSITYSRWPGRRHGRHSLLQHSVSWCFEKYSPKGGKTGLQVVPKYPLLFTTHACRVCYSSQVRYHTQYNRGAYYQTYGCGWWGWSRCTRYVTWSHKLHCAARALDSRW